MERPRRSGDTIENAQAPLIFLHIPKTAGTTFNSILRDVYGAGFLRIKPRHWQKTRRIPADVRVITGHMPWGVHKRWDVAANYVTFLRDPVERIISLWWHAKKHTNHKRHSLARRLTVGEFAQSRAFADLDNGMVRWLAGGLKTGIAQRKRPVTEEDYETALIHCTGMLVGNTSTFKRDVRRFANRLGWGQMPRYQNRMVGKGRPCAATFDRAGIDIIRQVNQWDCQLYEMIKGE
jgi:hypothetical protein